LPSIDDIEVPARVVHLPLSWDDESTRVAIDKYMKTVRPDAPWCPSNIEFIRRINGLDSIDEVKKIVFGANYLVMGLGDVYLGAPVATPLDPRHRLVTTKYNPARTWTPENAVGIGGAYMTSKRASRGCCAFSTRSSSTRSAPRSCTGCARSSRAAA
jgi:urea carboxylase